MNRGAVGGYSFFLPPEMLSMLRGKDIYLDDGCELRLGLFQAVALGNEFVLNVEVIHKAFPRRYDSLIDMFKDMRLKFPIDQKRSLDKEVIDALKRRLAGLDICYTQPGSGLKKVRKFMDVDEKPSKVIFFDSNGVQTNVLKYFKDRRMEIEYLELPCIKIGNRERNISVPMEFCSISDGQVKTFRMICKCVAIFIKFRIFMLIS